MPRTYRVTFENVGVAAAQDLLQVKGAAGKMLRIKRCWVGATNSALVTAQSIRIRCRYLPTTVSDGSGGSTPTPQKVDPGDAAASATALANSTTPATTNGTAVVVDTAGVHIHAGYDNRFENPPAVGPSTSFVFELLSTPSGTMSLSGGCEFEEIG